MEKQDDEMYCPECGKLIDINSINCKFCGENIDDVIKHSKIKKVHGEERDLWKKKYFEPSSTAEERTKQIECNKNIETMLEVAKVAGAAIWGGIMGFFKALFGGK